MKHASKVGSSGVGILNVIPEKLTLGKGNVKG